MDGPGNGDTDRQGNKPVAVSNIKAPPIYIAFVIQFLLCVVAALVAWLMLDTVAAYSTLLGGFTCILPNSFFAWRAFRYRGARNTPLVVKSFYVGEAGKLVMTVVLFAIVFAAVRPLNELAVIVGFILTILVGLGASTWVTVILPGRQNRKTA